MRIRKKKWAAPELAVCPYYIADPSVMTGRWHSAFADNSRPLYLELGCGKGIFAAQHALRYPQVNIIAADIKEDMLAVGRRTVENMFAAADREHDNIMLLKINIMNLSGLFSPEDTVDRIYINFCNPWNRGKHNKRRLTHPRQLIQYSEILRGDLRFKTDDDELFRDSVEYFKECGWEITCLTEDLQAEDFPDNLITEHERMFVSEGIKIKYLTAIPPKISP